MKEETKIILSKVIIMLERQLGDLEQDKNNIELSERERKGIKLEEKEILSEIANTKKCFNWVCDQKPADLSSSPQNQ